MKTWHLLSNRWNSAITEYAMSAMRSLRQHGHHIAFTPLDGRPAHRRALQYGIETWAVPTFSPIQLFRLARVYRQYRPDAIFVYGGPEHTLASLLSEKPTFRFYGAAPRPRRVQLGRRFVIKKKHVSFFPSETLRQQYAQSGNLTATEVESSRVISLGCDTAKFHRRSLPRQPSILVVGRLDPVKGHREFFPLFAQLLKNWNEPNFRPTLRIIGEPANLSSENIMAAAVAAGLKIGQDVEVITSRVPDIEDEMERSLLGLVPSIGSEVICRVAEEFLLCGTPILVSRVGSLEECLFPNAGSTLPTASLEEQLGVLRDVLLHAFEEKNTDREERARQASRHFSFATMGEALNTLLSPS